MYTGCIAALSALLVQLTKEANNEVVTRAATKVLDQIEGYQKVHEQVATESTARGGL